MHLEIGKRGNLNWWKEKNASHLVTRFSQLIEMEGHRKQEGVWDCVYPPTLVTNIKRELYMLERGYVPTEEHVDRMIDRMDLLLSQSDWVCSRNKTWSKIHRGLLARLQLELNRLRGRRDLLYSVDCDTGALQLKDDMRETLQGGGAERFELASEYQEEDEDNND